MACTTVLSENALRAAVAAVLLMGCAPSAAVADPCVQACRSDHNACRMAAKLLMSARCDAALQACIGQCFSGNRGGRDVRPPRDLRDFHEPRGPHGPGFPSERH